MRKRGRVEEMGGWEAGMEMGKETGEHTSANAAIPGSLQFEW